MNARLSDDAVFFIQKQGLAGRGNTNSIATSSVPAARPDNPRCRIAAVSATSACTVMSPTVSARRTGAGAAAVVAIPDAASIARHASMPAFRIEND